MLNFSKEDLYDLPEERRRMYLKIMDKPVLEPFIGPRLQYLEDHFPTHQLDKACKWLLSNDLVGSKFTSWYRVECHGSDLEMTTKLVAIVNNEDQARLVAGKTFKL